MVKGIGVDIIEVQRVARLLERDGRFAERLFTAAEIAYCEGKHFRAQHYAARFTAKEAFFKALGSGWRDGMGWHEVEVVHDALGKPSLRLWGRRPNGSRNQAPTHPPVHLAHARARRGAGGGGIEGRPSRRRRSTSAG